MVHRNESKQEYFNVEGGENYLQYLEGGEGCRRKKGYYKYIYGVKRVCYKIYLIDSLRYMERERKKRKKM